MLASKPILRSTNLQRCCCGENKICWTFFQRPEPQSELGLVSRNDATRASPSQFFNLFVSKPVQTSRWLLLLHLPWSSRFTTLHLNHRATIPMPRASPVSATGFSRCTAWDKGAVQNAYLYIYNYAYIYIIIKKHMGYICRHMRVQYESTWW